ncbi:DUF3298 and DUF4163 domain-containing protein [Sporosarcina siberiensis]|uniref:DUF3298 and DUF4163 domain-containing protein n=1 Tax=Sporosarcina siberiensis TaxID=1365606 RepID=A0ABW4SCG4_9BACL
MDLPVSIRTHMFIYKTPNVKVYYPTVINLKNRAVEQKVNEQIISTFNKMLIEQYFFDPILIELIAYFEIKTNLRGILSLNLIVYSFTGGAHGMTIIKSLTFDVHTGKDYSLNELFKPGSDYEKTLSGIIRQKIKVWDIQLIVDFEGVRSGQDFYIADSVLVIYFQLYEITPYAVGFPYFPIPIMDIADSINPDGPLNRMMSFT